MRLTEYLSDTKRILIATCVASIMTLVGSTAQAQDYKYEIGIESGISSYWGDANQSTVIYKPGFTGGAVFRYVINYRWAIRANLSIAMVSGNSADQSNKFPGGENFTFNTTLFDAGCRAEFNFFNYGMGQAYEGTSRLSPYITAGLALNFGFPDHGNFFTVSVPFGVGLKYKVAQRWNLGLEFAMHKTLTDMIDGQDDPYGIESSLVKNTDWFSTLVFSVTYDFGFKTLPCNGCPNPKKK